MLPFRFHLFIYDLNGVDVDPAWDQYVESFSSVSNIVQAHYDMGSPDACIIGTNASGRLYFVSEYRNSNSLHPDYNRWIGGSERYTEEKE